MAPIRIPERYENGLLAIFSLSDNTIEELVSALQDAPPKIVPSSISEGIAPRIKSIPSNELTSIVETLLSLYYTKIHHDIQPSEMAQKVCDAVDESIVEDLDSFIENQDKFKDRLTKLLSIQSFDVLSKAILVLRGSENIFHDARIITEIRPIFGPDVNTEPTAAVILHMLNITYHRESETKELYIALDNEDLDVLRKAIERASQKAKSLKSLLDTAKLTNITLD